MSTMCLLLWYFIFLFTLTLNYSVCMKLPNTLAQSYIVVVSTKTTTRTTLTTAKSNTTTTAKPGTTTAPAYDVRESENKNEENKIGDDDGKERMRDIDFTQEIIEVIESDLKRIGDNENEEENNEQSSNPVNGDRKKREAADYNYGDNYYGYNNYGGGDYGGYNYDYEKNGGGENGGNYYDNEGYGGGENGGNYYDNERYGGGENGGVYYDNEGYGGGENGGDYYYAYEENGDNVKENYGEAYKNNEYDYEYKRKKRQTSVCRCFPPAQCNNTGNNDGSQLIDPRITGDTCTNGLVYCCRKKTSEAQLSCGSRITNYITYPLQNGQAKYGDYPWMVMLQKTSYEYVGGGILIDTQYVLTAAHKISSYRNGAGLRVRLGEWDSSATYEQYPYKDYNISQTWIHESFNAANLKNDIALIKLSTTVSVYPEVGVVPICLPSASQTFDGQRCWVAGWGKDQFGPAGKYQSLLRATDVPILTTEKCQASLRKTRLGAAYVLDKGSFLCAGGEAGKDSCTGDGGSGLVCEVSTGRWVLAGLVAWGIGCANESVPGAYVNVVSYVEWIRSKQK